MRENLHHVDDILGSIEEISEYVRGMEFGDYALDTKTQRAVERNLEIIGEAVKNITSEIKKKHPGVMWKEIAGMRDKLIHQYFGVNLETIWFTIKNQLPSLRKEIIKIRKSLNSK